MDVCIENHTKKLKPLRILNLDMKSSKSAYYYDKQDKKWYEHSNKSQNNYTQKRQSFSY